MTKKSPLLFLFFVISVLNINAAIYSGSCGYNASYTLDTATGILSITGTGAMADYSQYSDRPWNTQSSYIKTIKIADGITSIGRIAFSQCSNLTSVTIPNTVTSIGESAFIYCPSLTSIAIPNSVTSMGESAFYNCSSLASVTIGNSVTSIGRTAFHECTSLTSIIIPNSVTSIGYEAFYKCSGLTSVIIGNSVTSIGDRAFYGTNLNTLIVGTGVLSFGYNAFSTYPVKTIWLPNTPPERYTYAQGTVNYVANSQYSGLNNMKEYKFLSSMFEVDGIRYVPVSPSERTCDAIDCVYDESAENITIGESITNKGISLKIQNIQPYLCYKNSYIKDMNIVSGYKGDIPSYSFYGCASIVSANISNQGSIAEKAFYGSATSNPATFTINNNGSIGTSAFEGCTSIISATINNQGYIGQKAFYGSATSNPATFTITNNGSIGTSAFESCTKITQLTLDNNGSIGGSCFSGCTSLQTVTLGNNISYIGASAFKNCSRLGSIVIPDSVQTLGGNAFNGCSSIKTVKIGDGIKMINESTFSGCSSLKDVEIGNTVTSIETSAFSGCKALPKIIIPQNVAAIGNNVFSGCTKLKTVIMADRETDGDLKLGYNGSNPLFVDCPLDSVYIGRNISYSTSSSYGYSPFYRNTSLRSVTITDKETEISENEFYGCTNLQNVKIGDGVTSIGNWAFSGCSSLKNFSFGTQVNTIGQEAFSDCTAVTAITSKAQTPPTCGSQALDDINKWECTLYVPEGHVADYQSADQWKEFFFIEEGDIPVFIRGDVNGDGVVNGTDIQAIINLIVESLYDEKCDVNEDGQVNGTDIQEVINYIVYGPDEDTGDDDNGDDEDEIYDNIIFEDSTYGDAENNCTPKADSGWELWQAGERRTPGANYNYNGTRIFNDLGLKGLKVGYYCNGQWPNGYMIYGNASLEGAPTLTLPADRLKFTYHAANWKVEEARKIHFQVLNADNNVVAEKITYTSDKSMDSNRNTSYEADKFTFEWDCPKEGKYKIKFGSPAGETFIGNISIARRSSSEP